MAILRPFFTPFLPTPPAQLNPQQRIQAGQQQQQQNPYASYFQPQATGQQAQGPEFEQPSYDTANTFAAQYAKVQQNRQNAFQPSPMANDPVAATQTNSVTNFMQTSAARPSFQEFYDQLGSISGRGEDATAFAQQQAASKQSALLNGLNSNGMTGGSLQGGGDRVSFAKSLLGTPYVWGGADKNGTDCSGLVYQVLNASGTKVPRVTAAQYGRMGTGVSLAQAQPGDVVYFDEPGATDHVGIYIGNGQMIDAPYSGAKVRVDRVGNFTSIRRIGSSGSSGNQQNSGNAGKAWQSNQQLGQSLLGSKGWSNQWNSFNNLVMHESGWNNTAQNPSSTAFGIGQFLNSTWGSYGSKTSDPRLQILYMLDYIRGRYGDPNRAWSFWQQHKWY